MKKKFSSLFKKPRICVLIFFLSYLAIGVSIYKDYGVSWDEPSHREIGGVTTKYLSSIFLPDFHPPEFASLPPLAEYSARHYGVVFDLPMYVAELFLGFNGKMPEAYFLRHLCTFLLFYISVFFFFLIVKNRFNSWQLGLMACLFLILSPRIFADSFYGKDVVLLSLLIISIYFFIEYLKRKTVMSSILFALATALVVDQRITGIFIPFLVVFTTGIDTIKQGRPSHNISKLLFPPFIYLISFLLFMVLFWPYLWEKPVANFIDAFTVMKTYSVFTYDVFYFGKFIKSTAISWHYIPVWILITTPLIYILLFLLGLFGIIKAIVRNGVLLYSNENEQQDFIFLLTLAVPLVSVVILDSALYDGWRHLYFIYASFLLVAMTGFAKVVNLAKEVRSVRGHCATMIIAAIVALYIGSTSYQMIRNHPYQNVYFNVLAGSKVGQKFDLDYWGLSFRQGLEYIFENDKRPVIRLSANAYPPLLNNAVFLESDDIYRLRLTSISQADYFLTNYRWHPQPYQLGNEVYSISVDNIKIMSVFKLR